MDGEGIIIRNPDSPDKMIILKSYIVELSEDGGVTWKHTVLPGVKLGEFCKIRSNQIVI